MAALPRVRRESKKHFCRKHPTWDLLLCLFGDHTHFAFCESMFEFPDQDEEFPFWTFSGVRRGVFCSRVQEYQWSDSTLLQTGHHRETEVKIILIYDSSLKRTSIPTTKSKCLLLIFCAAPHSPPNSCCDVIVIIALWFPKTVFPWMTMRKFRCCCKSLIIFPSCLEAPVRTHSVLNCTGKLWKRPLPQVLHSQWVSSDLILS